MKAFLCLLLCSIFSTFAAHATHLKGAELTAKPALASSFTYTFTLILYEEKGGLEEATILDLDDGSKASLSFVSEENLEGGFVKRTYTATHTYAAAGLYQVSYTGSSRSHSVNITDDITTRFHIELPLFINQTIGLNSSPVFKNPPQFLATAGESFTDDYSAVDAEGDSLVYKFVTPFLVSDYVFPHKVGSNTENTFEIHPTTGRIIWDVPEYIGKYVFSVQIEEWRNDVRIGLTYRDIQITVIGSNGPVIPPPGDTNRSFNIYPNPVSGKVFISLPEPNSQIIAEIWSIKGEFLIRKQLQLADHADGMIDVQHLPAGIYVIKLIFVNAHFTSRLVIMR